MVELTTRHGAECKAGEPTALGPELCPRSLSCHPTRVPLRPHLHAGNGGKELRQQWDHALRLGVKGLGSEGVQKHPALPFPEDVGLCLTFLSLDELRIHQHDTI